MPRLVDLDVPRVDLVDRAAVRDPENPDQPLRFLVFKAAAKLPTNGPAAEGGPGKPQ